MRRASLMLTMLVVSSCSVPSTPGPVCGDGLLEAGELCDGADVRGVTCELLGLGPGVVRCASTCARVDTSGCSPIDAGATVQTPDAGLTTDAGVAPDAGQSIDAGPPRWLTVSGSVLEAGGQPVSVKGAISCCGGGYGWPLFDEAWVDLVSSRGATFLHARLGPFLTQNPNGETDWAPVGGGYVEVNGKADLTRFNEAYWARVRSLLEYARARGLWVELDVLDAWGVKHCKWGDIPGYSPWDSAFNVQAVDACAGAGGGALVPGSVHEAWVKKVVLETGRYDHVLYQDGNEVGIVGGYSPAWSISMAALIRAEEARLGYGRHLFGTNSGHSATIASAGIDFVELHQDSAATLSQCGGKPCLVNEYNPRPSLTPAEFHAQRCAAEQAGTWFWYWRHGQSASELTASLDLLDAPCP